MIYVLSTGLGLLLCTVSTLVAVTLREHRSRYYRGPIRILGQLAGDGARVRPVLVGIFVGWLIAIGASIVWDLTSVRDSFVLGATTTVLVLVGWMLVAARIWRIANRDR